jgi:hypothetical protein
LRALQPWDITRQGSLVEADSGGVKSQPRRVTLSEVWKVMLRCGIVVRAGMG